MEILAARNSESLPEIRILWGVKAIVRLTEGIGGLSSCYCRSKVRSFGQWVPANCAAPPTANAGQYTASSCKPLLFGFLYK